MSKVVQSGGIQDAYGGSASRGLFAGSVPYVPTTLTGNLFSFDDPEAGSGAVWLQKGSGASSNAVQATGSMQPIVTPMAVAGRVALKFDGANDFMTFTTQATPTFTWWLATQPVVVGQGGYAVLIGNPNSVAMTLLVYETTNNGYGALNGWIGGGGSASLGTFACADAGTHLYNAGEPNIVALTYESPVCKIYLNNTLCKTNSSLAGLSQSTNMLIGGGDVGFTYVNGYIAEVHGFDHVQSTDDRNAMFNYLIGKYPKP